jgi:hypothetical protein
MVNADCKATEVYNQLQCKSTMTLSFVDSPTFRTCIGDQLTVIDDWLCIQPGFILAQDKTFHTPFDDVAFTIDLTWQQYERQKPPSTGRTPQKRGPLKMIKKDPLLAIRYDGDMETEIQWNDIQTDSVIRAVV